MASKNTENQGHNDNNKIHVTLCDILGKIVNLNVIEI